MAVTEVPEPPEPGTGMVIVRPEAVGLCGSDFHYFQGDIGAMDPSMLYPRIQGHELSAVVEEIGPGCPPHLRTGERVAIWPVGACGRCYPCRIGRGNVCGNLRLLGVHTDGGLQERLAVRAEQLFPVGDQEPAVTAVVEPVSIAVRTVARGRVAAGERVVVLGAGPIGQAVALAATDRGASVLLVDRVPSRLGPAGTIGVETLCSDGAEETAAAISAWAGADGPEVIVEATGVPELVGPALELVAQAGRVVVVGLSDRPAPLRVGALPFKEVDLLGVSCCSAGDFAEAVALVARHRDVAAGLVTHEFPLERAPEAIAYAIAHPAEVMKAVVRVTS